MTFVPWDQRKQVASDLRAIYQASTLEQAEAALTAFTDR